MPSRAFRYRTKHVVFSGSVVVLMGTGRVV
ncbi:hypothetical protein CCACVL1_14801 [Corchorus capsularis]|uniref:Uncharacterized protein n=1 Tax=Corchorus capsularis TaxID=210143 RepID=A0A1R3I5F8_COCAP|nr:hypothetical protein CCACVL1_14801 [Corchorus capsularis]